MLCTSRGTDQESFSPTVNSLFLLPQVMQHQLPKHWLEKSFPLLECCYGIRQRTYDTKPNGQEQ